MSLVTGVSCHFDEMGRWGGDLAREMCVACSVTVAQRECVTLFVGRLSPAVLSPDRPDDWL
jgi:hypothetical protein